MVVFACALLAIGSQQLKRDIPNESWEPIFFGNDLKDAQSINGRAKLSDLPALREKVLPKGHIEIRIWQGFGITYLEGYRFYFDGGKWRAWKMEPAIPGRKDLKDKKFLTELKPPTMGWPEFWKGMDKEGVYTLPDFDSLPTKKNTVFDGMSYVVEFQKAGLYRTYCYNNPSYQPRGKEVDSMLSIAILLRKAFPKA
jgi:hypothetical protein